MLLLYNQFDEIIYKVLKIFLIGENIMIKSIKVKDNIHRNYSILDVIELDGVSCFLNYWIEKLE